MHIKKNILFRLIAIILVIAFLWQDVVWAYPDISHTTLAPTTLNTRKKATRSFTLVATRYIRIAINLRKDFCLNTVKDVWWPTIGEGAKKRKLKQDEMPRISDISELAITTKGFIEIFFPDESKILFYNPEIAAARRKLEEEKISPDDANTVNQYLHVQFIEPRESQEERAPSPTASRSRRFGSVTDKKER